MKLLILGQSGFIGKNLYEYFNEKHEVLAPSHSELDVMEEKTLYKYLSKHNFDVVLNALDLRSESKCNAEYEYLYKRLRMFMNLEKYADCYGKQIYYGTGAEYSKHSSLVDIKEVSFGKTIPTDAYGFLMYTCNSFAAKSSNLYNFRLFGIFGKYENYKTRFISNAICKALMGFPITIRQNAVFDYLYVSDLCKFTDYGINNPLNFHDYNATSGNKYELLFLASTVKKVLNCSVDILVAKEGNNFEYSSCNNRIMEEMSVTLTPIEQSIIHLVKYYKENLHLIDKSALLY